MKMIALNSVKIRFLKLPNKKIARRIQAELMNLIMEAMRLKDEAKSKREDPRFDSDGREGDPEISGNSMEDEIAEAAGPEYSESVNMENLTANETETPTINKEDFVMALEVTFRN